MTDETGDNRDREATRDGGRSVSERRFPELLETALDVPAKERPTTSKKSGGGPWVPTPASGHATPSIPGFVIERTLGEGGMGRVYLAHQTRPVERTVAVKMIAQLGDPKIAQRFAAEQKALARLNHPAIAQLYDAGTTPDGHPYVVMEYVDGTPLTDYCDRERLSIEDRLRLFVAVCRGIEHAHRRQLLHRDLKPSNLLVTESDGQPVPKIIDFGIARALDVPLAEGDLATGTRILGTPHYMSPEALEPREGLRDLDTRTDVYSLGVVLYELLTGARPFDSQTGHVASLLRRITDDDPPRPSTRVQGHDEDTLENVASARSGEGRELIGRLDGDLDWIAVKALARDREQRYGSAAALADDIERSLRHEPVTARPPSLSDRLVKAARRHRLAAALVIVTLVAVVAAAVLVSLALVHATRAEHRARAEAAATRQTLGFLISLFEAARPEENLGRDLSSQELVALGAERIEEQELPPLQRARLLHTLADVQMRLGDYESGRDLAAEALAIRDQHLEESHPDVLASLDLLGNLERRSGRPEAAEPHLERQVATAEKMEDPEALADALNSLANLRWSQQRLHEAEELHGRALELRRALLESDASLASEVAASLNNLGVLYWSQSRFTAAEPYLRRAAELYERTLGPDHPRVADALGNLGIVLYNLGRLEEDEALQRRALAIREKVLDADHPDLSATLNNLAIALTHLERVEEAEAAHRRALEIRRRALGPEHDETLKTLTNLGLLLWRQGQFAEAESLQRQVLAARSATLGEDDPATARARVNVALPVRDAGRVEEAETLLRRALADQRSELGNDHRSVALTLFHLGVTAELNGRHEEAEALLREALAIREAVAAPKPLVVAETLHRLAGVLAHRGEIDEATELYRRALDLRRELLPAGHEDIGKTATELVRLEARAGG